MFDQLLEISTYLDKIGIFLGWIVFACMVYFGIKKGLFLSDFKKFKKFINKFK